VLSLPATSAFALNILLCNDDGVTAANVRALKQQLIAAGHSALVASPIDNQSGTGGCIRFLQPIPPLTGNERGAKALQLPAGTAGVGTDPSDADAHYVNGTPSTACAGCWRRRAEVAAAAATWRRPHPHRLNRPCAASKDRGQPRRCR